MSALYVVLLLDDQCAEWLDDEGMSYPAPAAAARFPTPREITSAIGQLEGYNLALSADVSSGEWLAAITKADSSSEAWAALRIKNYRSDDEPHEFYFPKGWPEVIFAVVERLTHHCGPLVVVDDCNGTPIVIGANDSLAELLRRYDEALNT